MDAVLAGEELEFEFVPVGFKKVGDGDAVDGFLHGVSPAWDGVRISASGGGRVKG